MIEIYCYDGGIKKLSLKELVSLKNKKIWVDVIDPTKQELLFLKEHFDVHPTTIEDLSSSLTRIKIEKFSNYLFYVFYTINKFDYNFNELDFLLGDHFIITCHKEKLLQLDQLKVDNKELTNLFKNGVDFMFYRFIDDQLENYFGVFESLDSEIDKIEKVVVKQPDSSTLSNILKIKNRIIKIKKRTFDQRDKLSSLAKNDSDFISEKTIPYIRDAYDHSIMIFDNVENMEEKILNLFDIYVSSISNKLNEIMKVLSIFATIALPLTVISSIFGTNFQFLPGLEHKYGFWIMISIMVLVCVLMLIFFKRRKWF